MEEGEWPPASLSRAVTEAAALAAGAWPPPSGLGSIVDQPLAEARVAQGAAAARAGSLLRERRARVVVLGPCKAGKSTLVDACVGDRLAHVGSEPATFGCTFVHRVPCPGPLPVLPTTPVVVPTAFLLGDLLAESGRSAFPADRARPDAVGVEQVRALNRSVQIGLRSGSAVGRVRERGRHIAVFTPFAGLEETPAQVGSSLTLVDTPGTNEFGNVEARRLAARMLEEADIVLVLVPAVRGGAASDDVAAVLQHLREFAKDVYDELTTTTPVPSKPSRAYLIVTHADELEQEGFSFADPVAWTNRLSKQVSLVSGVPEPPPSRNNRILFFSGHRALWARVLQQKRVVQGLEACTQASEAVALVARELGLSEAEFRDAFLGENDDELFSNREFLPGLAQHLASQSGIANLRDVVLARSQKDLDSLLSATIGSRLRASLEKTIKVVAAAAQEFENSAELQQAKLDALSLMLRNGATGSLLESEVRRLRGMEQMTRNLEARLKEVVAQL